MLLRAISMAREGDGAVENLRFEGAVLEGEDLSRLEFTRVEFVRCRFIGCSFDGALFYRCTLRGCDFANCRFGAAYSSRPGFNPAGATAQISPAHASMKPALIPAA